MEGRKKGQVGQWKKLLDCKKTFSNCLRRLCIFYANTLTSYFKYVLFSQILTETPGYRATVCKKAEKSLAVPQNVKHNVTI